LSLGKQLVLLGRDFDALGHSVEYILVDAFDEALDAVVLDFAGDKHVELLAAGDNLAEKLGGGHCVLDSGCWRTFQ
jgi:hypothetical protein